MSQPADANGYDVTKDAAHSSDVFNSIKPAELKAYLKRAHAVIAAALPKRKQAELGL